MDANDLTIVSTNAAQALGFLAFAGVITGLIYWRHAVRRDLLTAVIIFLLGTFIAQLPVHIGGMVNWSVNMILLSAVGRLIQVLGSVLFIRASLQGKWPDWVWMMVVLAVALLTWLV